MDERLGYAVRYEESEPGKGKSRFVHWTESDSRGPLGSGYIPENSETIDEAHIAALKSGVPPVVKRSGRERMQALARETWEWIQAQQKLHKGQWVPPKSLMSQIVEDSWRQGDPIPYERVETMIRDVLERTKHQSTDFMVPAVGRGMVPKGV